MAAAQMHFPSFNECEGKKEKLPGFLCVCFAFFFFLPVIFLKGENKEFHVALGEVVGGSLLRAGAFSS